ncbi:glycosyltransferase family 2 protein [Rhizorhabdus dicambivorans]|uniref:Glycosyl transferase n=1 Tax=Rhizorhabdus dicambivorans TaxID=1850238 RepID=A0A2A4FWK9_9SPHN|nr:glycosyltransferase [Rhizorhabdus dicambivorans]ATE66992.1 glycosyl transferase [Rhizorhabdus dicambivorans]PCE42132.1 glycosyl transferase [Rhizorhabdus dicambivorans]
MIEAAAWVLLLLAAWPALVLAVELAAAQLPARRIAAAGQPRITILIPAHDEAAGIAGTIAALRGPEGSRLLVVADNCGDGTAALAREAGAETIERHDPGRRGKGHALAFGRDHLAADPPDVVIVLDADCAIEGDSIPRLAAAAWTLGRPVQSVYLMRPRPGHGAMVGLSGFAFLLRNLVRQRGLARLGAPVLLTGSGMAFPWAAFVAAPLDSDDLTEDLGIGIALTRAGLPPAFLPDVTTWSDPARRVATLAQRSRWEQGFLRTALRQALPLLGKGSWLGLHLMVPPLALLALIELAALLLLFAAPLPFAILAAILGLLASLLLLSWFRFGRAQISAGRLLLIPFYIIWKLPLYGAALLRPERRWVRTERD